MKRYLVQFVSIGSSVPDQGFQTEASLDDLNIAKRYCALQVATNPYIQKGRVLDSEAERDSLYAYVINKKDHAADDLREWGLENLL